MINLGSHQFTLRWIIICSILYNFTLIIQANQELCNNTCNLTIQDEERTYLQFKKLTTSDSIKVIFFHLKIESPNFNSDNDSTVYFAWIKNDFGKAILTLPSSFVAMSLSLYTIFIDTLNITLIDSSHDCCKRYFNDSYRSKQIIFKTLVDFTQLNNTCNDESCATICLRNFIKDEGNFHRTVKVKCCQKDLVKPQINITQCLNFEQRPAWYVPWSMLVTVILSMFLAGFTVNKLINWFLSEVQRYRKMKTTPVYILNDITPCEMGHIYLPDDDDNNPRVHLTHAIKFVLSGIIIIALGYQSYCIQIFPNMFTIYPKMNPYSKSKSLEHGWILQIAWNGTFILMIIVADIKIYRYTKHQISQHLQYYDVSHRWRYTSPISFHQSYFQIKIYLLDIINDFKSLHIIKLILDLAALAFAILNFIMGSIGVLRCCIFLAETFTFRLKTAFLPDRLTCPFFNTIMSIFFTVLSFVYSGFIILHLLLIFQIIFRVILTTSAFIVTFASYFNFIIIMAIPFMHYVIQTIDTYIRNDQIIPNRIIHLQETLDQDIDQILQADQGNLDVYIAITYFGKLTIDLPEMLQDDDIRSCIKHYIQCLQHKPNHQMTDGISTLTIRYQKLPDNTFSVALLRCTNGCSKCPFQQEVQHLLHRIQQHLQDKDMDYFKSRLSLVYYYIENSPRDSSIAIPTQLYQYLRYHSSQISLNMGRILFNIIVIAGFFSVFVFTAMLDYRIKTFASLNSAIANTPIVYVATILSLRNLKLVQLKEEEIDKILLVNIIQYRRGYRLFCTRGVHFQPFVQLIRMAIVNTNHSESINNVHQYQLGNDTNNDVNHSTVYNNRIQSKSIWTIIKQRIGFTEARNYYVSVNSDYDQFP